MSPALAQDVFTNLNLMAGTARSLEQEAVNDQDNQVWNRDFALLADELSKFVDPELGADLKAEKTFYGAALQVAKGYFDKKPFGGLKAATGQYGFRLLLPQDLKTSAAGTTPAFYSWVQTITSFSSGRTLKTGAIGSSGGAFYTCSTANKQAVIAFHRLLSYKPTPRVLAVEWNVNSYPYTPYVVEPYSKISKSDKLFKIIPMPGRIILHPGGSAYATLYFDMEGGAVAPAAAPSNIDVEIALFGLVFAEYDYLASANLV
jgi:hypothetical protein